MYNNKSKLMVLARSYDMHVVYDSSMCERYLRCSGTPLSRHPSTADNHNITDNSKSPNCPSIHFST